METAAGNLFKEQKVRGFCHLYVGQVLFSLLPTIFSRFFRSPNLKLQEACAVGIKASMSPNDAIITSYRCHSWTFLMGATVAEVLSELTGNLLFHYVTIYLNESFH